MKGLSIMILVSALITSLCFAQSNWQAENSGTNYPLNGVSFVDENNGWVSGWAGIVLHTTNGGQTWRLQNTAANYGLYCVFFTDLQNGWAAGYGGEVVHTTDGGETWTSQDISSYDDINRLFFIDASRGWAVGGYYDIMTGFSARAIYSTTDGGSNWNVQYRMSYEPELHSVRFTDGDTGYAAGGSAILKTTDSGNNWFVEQNLPSFDLSDVFFTSSTTGFVAGEYEGVPHYSSVFRTTDGGNNWNQTSLGTNEALAGLYFTDELNGWAVGNDFSGGNNLALIYRTTDGGNNWMKQSIPSFDALASVSFIDGTKGWAVGHLGTIISTEVTTSVGSSSRPTEFTLSQNYPNPFNPSTRIKFDLPEASTVSLIIYDVLGRQVAQLATGYHEAGYHSVTWNASNQASGIYFARFNVTDAQGNIKYMKVNKLVLMK